LGDLDLSNMLDGLGGSEDFISKRRMDLGDEDDDDQVPTLNNLKFERKISGNTLVQNF
jgi:hypothetical protein